MQIELEQNSTWESVVWSPISRILTYILGFILKGLTMKKLALILLFLLIPFGTGCGSLLRSTFDTAKEELKEWTKEEISKALEAVEKKRKEVELKQLGELDKQLEKLGEVKKNADGTSEIVKKTWKDFDTDKDESLSPAEELEVSKYVGLRIAKMVAAGEISAAEGGQIAKGAGGILAMLLLLYGAKKGKDALAKKVKPDGQPDPPKT